MSIQDLREKRQSIAAQARELMDATGADQWTDEHSGKYDAMLADIDKIDSQIERHEKLMQAEAAHAQRVNARAEKTGISADHAAHTIDMEKGVFAAWLKGGVNALTHDQRQFVDEKRRSIQNAMSVGTDAEGGYLVPDDFSGQLIEELKAFGGMRAVATVMQTAGGNTIPFPTVDDTANVGELVGENAATSTQDFTFGIKNLEAYKYSSKDLAIPFELLQDERVDLESYVRRALAERIHRITNQHFTTGTGTAQPNGVVTASAQGLVGQTGQTTTVIYDDLVDLIHSVDPAYRQSGAASFMFHDTTLKALKKLKDSNGIPLWQPGVALGEPDTLLGYRYTVNQDVPTMAANAKSILFGDFSKYIIRDVMQVLLFRMTDSAYTKNGQVGFLAFSRHDGELVDAAGNSIKHYANSAT